MQKKKIGRYPLTKFIVNRVAKFTNVSKKEISLTKPFNYFGLSSLDGIQLVNDLNQYIGTDYSATILFDYPTIESLIKFLLDPVSQEVQYTQKISAINEPIAIVGMSCEFPQAKNLDAYWELLKNGKSAVTDVPEDRWTNTSKRLQIKGGFIDSPDSFDNNIFDIYEKESRHLDPQQRKLLQLSWLAIEHSGYAPSEVMGTNTGVYMGISSHDYSLAKVGHSDRVDLFDGLGGAHSITANRISYMFNFHGPSWAVDTACSSSLISLSQAVGHLRSGECDMALAGGINILYTSHITEAFMKAGMLSSTGSCKTFSDDADGYVRGEGGGVLVLKRQSDAIRDNDKIWGVIKGFAYNQDGRSNGLTAPNGKAQEAVIKKALSYSKLEPHEIDYIEAHGTGTPLGDPIEYHALKSCFKDRDDKLYIGSVKTNIGHLESAAGIASVIKVVLAMNKNYLPSSLNFSKLNTKINAINSPIEVLSNGKEWKGIKRAGVSSFGFGGTNAHLILESFPQTEIKSISVYEKRNINFLMFGASTSLALTKLLENVAQFLESVSDEDFPEFCYHRNKITTPLKTRVSITASSRIEMIEKIKARIELGGFAHEFNTSHKVFLFTGQGSQYPDMAKELFQGSDFFKQQYKEVEDLFVKRHQVDFNKVNARLDQTQYAQIALFTLEYALYKTIEQLGVQAEYFLGHSLGEIIAATCANAIKLEDAVDLIYYRGQAMQKTPAGGMLVCYSTLDLIEESIQKSNERLSVAAINMEKMIVVSGEADAVKRFSDYLTKQQIENKKLSVEQAFHSYLMDTVLEEFRANIKHIQFLEPDTPIISSVTGEVLEEIDTNYWVRQIREKTNFYKACLTLEGLGIKNFVEIGAHPALTQMCSGIFKEKGYSVFTLRRKINSLSTFFDMIGKLYESGEQIEVRKVFDDKTYTWLETPLSVLDEKRFNFYEETDLEAVATKKVYNYEEIQAYLIQTMAGQLDIAPDKVDPDFPIINLGADSLVLLNILDTIRDKFGVEVTIADVFQTYTNLNAIAKKIFIDYSDKEEMKTAGDENSTQNITRRLDKDFHENSMGVLGNFNQTASQVSLNPGIEEEYLKELIHDFTKKTKASKEWSGRYRKNLADNRVSAGFRPNLKEMVYPIVWKKASGAYFWDLDNNKYIDFTMGFGVNLFGHSPSFINEKITEQLSNGMALGPQSDMAALVAKEFCEITGNERIAFLNSGTEAIMTGIRLARAKSGREKIVIFEGSYHGHFDGVLGRTNPQLKTVPVAPGVPSSLIDGLVVLEYGAQSSIDYITEHGHEFAAVLVEPVQSRYPEHKPKCFLQALRKATEIHDTALFFDEVITGLRVHIKGAQEYFGVKADLAAYGKVLGGGMPIGAIAGRHEYLDFIDGGDWSFGDNSMPQNAMTFFAGTFCKHSLAMAASYAVLSKLKETNGSILEELNKKTKIMVDELNQFFQEKTISLRLVSYSSLFRFKFKGNMDLLFYYLNLEGIYIWEGRNLFLSTAHSDDDINTFISKTKLIVKKLIKVGYLKLGDSGVELNTCKEITSCLKVSNVQERPMLAEHIRFAKMSLESKEGELASKITVAIKVRGDYQSQVLKKAIEKVLNRHESLKSFYDLKGQRIYFNQLGTICVNIIDFSELPKPAAESQKLLQELANEKIDLSESCVDVSIILEKVDEAIIVFSAHHIALDGLSLAMISFDIAHEYSFQLGFEKKPKIKEVSYIEFMDSIDLSEEKKNRQLSYWLKQYATEPLRYFGPILSYKGGRVAVDLTADLSKKIKFYGYKNKSSLMNTFLLCLLKLLKKRFNRSDFVVGVPIAGHKNISDTMVGNCVNLLPFRLNYNEQNDVEMIFDIKNYQLESFKYSDVSFELLKETLQKNMIEIILNVEPINELPLFGGLKSKLVTFPSDASEYPVYINVMKVDGEINVTMDYQETAFKSKEKADEFLKELINILESTLSM